MQDPLAQALQEKIVIFDGAMGTEIYRRNFFVNASYENLCLTAPAVIREIHESYLKAGAMVLTTNSFGANSNKLRKFGLADKMTAINAASVHLAREAAGDSGALIAASIGPVGDAPEGIALSEDDCIKILAEQASALAEAKPDFILFETLTSLKQLKTALKAAEAVPGLPFVVSMTVDRDGLTRGGEPASEAFRIIEQNGTRRPTAFGLNCGTGPGDMLHAVEQLIRLSPCPMIAQPNAGPPKNVDDRMIYMCSPEYFTTYAMRFASLGVRGIGGCCGTTPDHIADMARSVAPMSRINKTDRIIFTKPEVPLQEPVPLKEKSTLAAKIAMGKWVHTVEIVPPQGYLLAQTIEKSKICAEAGFDAVNIPDGPRASSRVSTLVTAVRIQEGAGIEAILHCCCRDRNLIGMQADLLGCAAMNVNNILFITGDPPKLGNYPFASGVFDVDSIGIVKVQARLNRGVDIGGRPIDAPTKAFICVGADPNAIDMEREIRRTREKIASGAETVITQPVFDTDALFRFMDKVPELADGSIPLIAGVWPLASYRNAEFMKNEVPGVVVPDSIMERMAKADSKEEQRETGIRIAREAVAALKGKIAGVQIAAPFGRADTAIAVMKA